jgi:hypothetical protein
MNERRDYATYERVVRSLNPEVATSTLPFFYAASLGESIEHVVLDKDEDMLTIRLGSGSLKVWDDGQSCCESRYMTTDDELDTFIGAKLVNLEAVAGPDIPYEGESYGDTHEQMFVKVETTAGTITLVTHNEHNGYYGGFDVRVRWEDKRY